MKRSFCLFLAAAVALTVQFAAVAADPPPDKVPLTDREVENHLRINKKMNPDSDATIRKFRRLFGKGPYNLAQMMYFLDGKPDTETPEFLAWGEQKGKPPRDAHLIEEVQDREAVRAKLGDDTSKVLPWLKERLPSAEWASTEQVLIAEKFAGKKPPTAAQIESDRAVMRAAKQAREAEWQARQGWRTPRIRRDWRDVLYDEDPSLGPDNAKAIGDMEGALISYTRDGIADADMWTAHGAVILPYTREFREPWLLGMRRFSVAPSVTYDRVTTNADPTVEVDSLLYRLGAYMDFYGAKHGSGGAGPDANGVIQADTAVDSSVGLGLQLRAAVVHATDEGHQAGMNGYEVEVEPRLHVGHAGLGYRTILWRKIPARKDKTDISLLEMQLRAYLRLEGGDVQKPGTGWIQAEDSFFRLGPTVKLQVLAPSIPGDRTLSLTVLYSYLAAVTGPSDHPWYFRSTLDYDLFNDPELNHSVGLSVSYERGGLNFTKQEVDTLTVGISVIF